MDNILYRKAEKADVIMIATLITKLLGTCNLDDSNSIMDNNMKDITETIQQYYVCEVNGIVVGACGISEILLSDNYNLRLHNIREILYLVVDKQYQRKGIGTTLLKLSCKGQKSDVIYEAWGDNGKYVNSKYILEKCGFKLYKDLGKNYYKSHNYCPLCVNKDKQCKTCLAQIWIKRDI